MHIRLIAFISFFILSSFANSQELTQGNRYYLKAPINAFRYESTSGWTGSSTYSGTLAQSAEGTSINGTPNWLGSGFPIETAFVLKKIKVNKKTGKEEIELAGESVGSPIIKLISDINNRGLTSSLLIPALDRKQLEEWKSSAYAELAKNYLQPPLNDLDQSSQRKLLEVLKEKSISKPGIIAYKENQYFSIDYGSGDSIFNTIQLNQNSRVARRFNDLISNVVSIFKSMNGCPSKINGIKINFQASYKNFLDESQRGEDKAEIYINCKYLEQFSDADITSQELIKNSIVIVDGNRIEISLYSE